jgi:Galactose oxidase, central domain
MSKTPVLGSLRTSAKAFTVAGACLLGLAMPALAGRPRNPAPGANLRKMIAWGSECKQPDGKGLSFGGQHQKAEDGRPHTRLLVGDKWLAIHEQLRRKNPLQKHYHQLWALRIKLRDLLGKSRYIFFEGRTLDAEKAFLKKSVNPDLAKVAADIGNLKKTLASLSGLDKYAAGQVKLALKHIDAALPTVKPFAGRTEPGLLAAMRRAQMSLEIAAERLDAEPPPRVCSRIAYDAKTKLYVIFGGDHYDYLTNDIWTFDPAKKRWSQRHPAGKAPEPRAHHAMSADGEGKVAISGGYNYRARFNYGQSSYGRVAGGSWTYDLGADKWTLPAGAKSFAPNSRQYRASKFLPEHYMTGARPDAAGNEAKLKALPVNTWVAMKPRSKPQRNQMGRDWGTSVLDSGNDLFLQWGGGHSAHGGTDVVQYHFATNRWEQPYPIEYCLGLVGSTSNYPCGYNFNGHPWIIMHAYKSYAYEPKLKRMIITGRNVNWKYKHDFSFYLYDGLTGTWGKRYPLHPSMGGVQYYLNSRVIQGDDGLLFWSKKRTALRLNTKALKWEPIKFQGKLPGCGTDGGGLVYDTKRKRMMMVGKRWKGKFDGRIHTLDMKTKKVVVLTPKGSEEVGKIFLRESAYNPDADIFLWAWHSKGKMVAYEPEGNRWVTLNIAGNAGFGTSSGHVYDAKRKLHWVTTNKGNVYCMRLDVKKAGMKTVE